MTGIGVIIILFQLFPFVGLSSPGSTIEVVTGISDVFLKVSFPAFLLGALSLAIIYLFPRINKTIPSPLVALVVGTLIAYFFQLDIAKIGEVPSGLPEIKIMSIFQLPMSELSTVFKFAFMLAALGAIDSLLTSVVADNVTKTRHDSNKELIGQGLGNMAASFVAGIPGAGATMRTVVNIKSGGNSKLSGCIHSLLLLVILLGAGSLASEIPLSVLAGILISVGIGIIDYKGLKQLTHIPRGDAVIIIVVLLVTVFGNLLNAVAIGVVMACLMFMKRMSDLGEQNSHVMMLEDHPMWPDEDKLPNDIKSKVYIKHLNSPLFFGFVTAFKDLSLDIDTKVRHVIIRMEEVSYVDQSGVYALEEVIESFKEKNIEVYMTGLNQESIDLLSSMNIFETHITEEYLFKNFPDCVKAISKKNQ